LTYKDNKTVKAVNYTIPEQKSFLGQIREPERVGVFVEGLNRDDIKALVQRKNFNEGLEKSYENMRIKATDLVTKAQNEAKSIRDEATAERNDKIAKADQIVTHQADILQKAKDWADGLRKKYNDLLNKIDELIGKKDTLEKEIAVIENSRDKLEPLRKEVEDLTRAKKILTGELDCELTQAKFMTTDEFKTDRMWTLRDKGKLLALYNDGHTRVVGTNSTGGLDDQTLYDRKMGLCKVGAFIDEERVKVPRSVLKELIQARDIDKPISQNLDNLIKQQRDVERVVKSRGLTL
jgi:F0F1-type ATP synthase membrane subunit b/b'